MIANGLRKFFPSEGSPHSGRVSLPRLIVPSAGRAEPLEPDPAGRLSFSVGPNNPVPGRRRALLLKTAHRKRHLSSDFAVERSASYVSFARVRLPSAVRSP